MRTWSVADAQILQVGNGCCETKKAVTNRMDQGGLHSGNRRRCDLDWRSLLRLLRQREQRAAKLARQREKEAQKRKQERKERQEREKPEREETLFTWFYDWEAWVRKSFWTEGESCSIFYEAFAWVVYGLSYVVYAVLWVAELVVMMLIVWLLLKLLWYLLIVGAIAMFIKWLKD